MYFEYDSTMVRSIKAISQENDKENFDRGKMNKGKKSVKKIISTPQKINNKYPVKP